MSRTARALLSAVAAASLTAAAPAAESRSSPEWGTASQSILTVYAWEFRPLDSRTVLGPTQPGTYLLYAVSSPPEVPEGYIEGPVHLPTGAIIDKIEIAGCDSSPSHDITAVLYRTQDPAQASVVLGSATLANFCGYTSSSPINHQVDNSTNSYAIEINMPVGDDAIGLRAVRVYYHLVVSDPPQTATFNDVPTSHPFFQYVEALAASQITGGCGNGNYCPDAPLTRGQMAVFLSKALGLSFPDVPPPSAPAR